MSEGGFLAAVEADSTLRSTLSARLRERGAEVFVSTRDDLILAAWKQFQGQGLWRTKDGVVAYDVDLANEASLKAELGGGDERWDAGELLWRAYRTWGQGFPERLLGAFGFALWDRVEKRLLVATDQFGVRPVVHASVPSGILVGSRIRYLLPHPSLDKRIEPNAVYQYLFFSAIPSPYTIYKEIKKLEPGNMMMLDQHGLQVKTYYDIKYRTDDVVGESYWLRAVPLQVRGAVGRVAALSEPNDTGCFLSGGTDSSSIAGFYSRTQGCPAQTFSIGFDEPGYNELDYAHIASEHFGTRQHDYLVTPKDVLSLIERLPAIYDEPFGNSSVIPTYYCAKMAKENGITVLLAGDGGDEIFGGNERYVTDLVFERYGAIPGIVRKKVIEPILNSLPGVGPIYKAKRYVRRANINNPDRLYSYNLLAERDLSTVFSEDFIDQIDRQSFLSLARAHWNRAAPAKSTDRLLYLDMKFTITDNDLRKVTQMTEAAGVRVRYPFLDRKLVDFSATIPSDLKVRPGRGRYIFKKALEGFLPQAIIEKSKHGFGLPIGPWFKKDSGLRQLTGDLLLSGRPRVTEWIRPGFISDTHQGVESDNASYFGANLWILLVMELWLRNSERQLDDTGSSG